MGSLSEERATELLDHLGTGVLLEDEQHHIVFIDDVFCRAVGMERERLIGERSSKLMQVPHVMQLLKDPNGFLAVARERVCQARLAQGDVVELSDGRVYKRDYIPMGPLGMGGGHLWVYHEVTQQWRTLLEKEREDEVFRKMIDNMGLGLIEMDPAQFVRDVNDHLCELIGLARHEIIGRSLEEFSEVEESMPLIKSKAEQRRKGEADGYEFTVRNSSGERRHLFASGVPLTDGDGTYLGSRAVILDITKRRVMERQLLLANERAEAALRTKDLFLASMSHELHTPMTAILGLCGELMRSSPGPKELSHLTTMMAAAKDLLMVIDGKLATSNGDDREGVVEAREVDVRSSVAHVQRICTPPLIGRPIQFTVHMDASVAGCHRTDQHRLEHVLMNLVGNAIKFTTKGRVTLKVEGDAIAEGHQNLRFIVEDTGRGISEEFMGQLFTPFSRDPAMITEAIHGSGLGLSICRQLVEFLGGTIVVESELGVGTTVTVELRLPVAESRELGGTDAPGDDRTLLKDLTVLVVDDNPASRLVITSMLAGSVASTLEASNGATALQLLCRHPVDVILTDLLMPVMDGQELIRIVQGPLRSDVPIVVLTAGMQEIPGPLRDMTGVEFLRKPFERDDLLKMLLRKVAPPHRPHAWHPQPTDEVALFDLSMLKRMMNDDPRLVNEVLQSFIEDAPTSMDDMVRAAETGDLHRVRATAHRIKPLLEMLGVTSALRTVEEIAAGSGSGEQDRSLAMAAITRREVSLVVQGISAVLAEGSLLGGDQA